jgi:hypothetical protein
MLREIEAERATVPIAGHEGHSVCRMHGAGGGPPVGNHNARKHGSAEAIALRRDITVLTRNTPA